MNAVSEKPAARSADAQSTAASAKSAAPRGTARQLIRPLIGMAAIAAAVVTGHWWFSEARWLQSTDNAYIQGDIAVLGPRIDGDVMTIHVANNAAVHAGDRLISFDPTDRAALLAQAKAAEAEQQAAILVARRQMEQQRTAIDQALAAIGAAEAEVTRAVANASRSGALVGAGWTSRQTNETAVADRLKADAALASARAQAETARQGLTVAEAQLVQSEAKRRSAAAQTAIAENNLRYTVVTAPFDGIVGNRAVQLGQHVMPGQQLLAVTPVAQKLYVVANFKETQLAGMKPGQKVLLTPDIDHNSTIAGRVASLAPATGALFSLLPPENATGNFTKVVQRVPVRIVIDPDDAAKATWLRAGLSVTAEIDTRGGDAEVYGLFGSALHAIGLR
jgi:membrane fusion protein (multidrug efflux system)